MTSLGLEKKLTCDLVLEEDDVPFAHMFGIFFVVEGNLLRATT